MKTICFWVLLVFFCISAAQAETWSVHSLDPAGGTLERHWEIRQAETGMEYFLQGQSKPVYTLLMTPNESRLALANGMIRRFSRGFLLLTDLPMPVFIQGETPPEDGEHCFLEYVGETRFQNCVKVKVVPSLSEIQDSFMQRGGVVLVWQRGQVVSIVGPGFYAERME